MANIVNTYNNHNVPIYYEDLKEGDEVIIIETKKYEGDEKYEGVHAKIRNFEINKNMDRCLSLGSCHICPNKLYAFDIFPIIDNSESQLALSACYYKVLNIYGQELLSKEDKDHERIKNCRANNKQD